MFRQNLFLVFLFFLFGFSFPFVHGETESLASEKASLSFSKKKESKEKEKKDEKKNIPRTAKDIAKEKRAPISKLKTKKEIFSPSPPIFHSKKPPLKSFRSFPLLKRKPLPFKLHTDAILAIKQQIDEQEHTLKQIAIEKGFLKKPKTLSSKENSYVKKISEAFNLLQEGSIIKELPENKPITIRKIKTLRAKNPNAIKKKEAPLAPLILPGIPNMEKNPLTELAEKQGREREAAKSQANALLQKAQTKILSLEEQQNRKLAFEKEISRKKIHSKENQILRLEQSLQNKLEKSLARLDIMKKKETEKLEVLQNKQKKKLSLAEDRLVKILKSENQKISRLEKRQKEKLEKAVLAKKDRTYLKKLQSNMKKELAKTKKTVQNKIKTEKKKIVTLKKNLNKAWKSANTQSKKKTLYETKKINSLKKQNKKKILSANQSLKKMEKNENKRILSLEKKQLRQVNQAKKNLKREEKKQKKKLIALEKKQKSDLRKAEISWKKERDSSRYAFVKKNKLLLNKKKKEISNLNKKKIRDYKKKNREERIELLRDEVKDKVDIILEEPQENASNTQFLNHKTFSRVWDTFVEGLDLEEVYDTAESRIFSNNRSLENQEFELFSAGVRLSQEDEKAHSVKVHFPQKQSLVLLGNYLDIYIPEKGGNLFSYEVLPKESVFISKDAFFSQLDSSNKQTSFNIPSSFLAGVPGLDDLLYSGWGIWAIQDKSYFDQWNFGYLGFGNITHATSQRDMNLLKKEAENAIRQGASPIINYSGSSMGSVFNIGEIPSIRFGKASMEVNFSNGSLSGAIDFTKDKIQLNGYISGSSFAGNGKLNGGGRGSFQGAFFGPMAQEAVGTFGTQFQSRQAVGSFGVSKEKK